MVDKIERPSGGYGAFGYFIGASVFNNCPPKLRSKSFFWAHLD